VRRAPVGAVGSGWNDEQVVPAAGGVAGQVEQERDRIAAEQLVGGPYITR
jgi:hypothetical protein